jgi:hypothetical protein
MFTPIQELLAWIPVHDVFVKSFIVDEGAGVKMICPHGEVDSFQFTSIKLL